jgi:HSP20 family protein
MTTIVRWSPIHELGLFERGMRRMLDDFGFGAGVLPAADVYETTDEFVVELDVPGFEEKELGIDVIDHTLIVKGERQEAKEQEEKDFRLRERLEQTFERRFYLPADADTKQVKATFGKGVLAIHAPKLAEPAPRTVEITKA